MLTNEHPYERLTRLILGIALFEGAYFWFAGNVAMVLYVAAFVLVGTGLSGFCAVYRLAGHNGCAAGVRTSRVGVLLLTAVALVLFVGGSYGSYTLTEKHFLQSFNALNGAYKQTLFETGQGNREAAIVGYRALTEAYDVFQADYATYRPLVVRQDAQLTDDLGLIGAKIDAVRVEVHTGDLYTAHLGLEEVRPILQDILRRNGFSMLAVALVDFHDAMEAVLEPANTGDTAGVRAAYPHADTALRAVEAHAQDEEIAAIRSNLEALRTSAEQGDTESMAAQASALKASFVKVYLARG